MVTPETLTDDDIRSFMWSVPPKSPEERTCMDALYLNNPSPGRERARRKVCDYLNAKRSAP